MSKLQGFLDDLGAQYHRKDLLWSDPLEFVHRFSDPWDQEAVALISALFAYGNVKQIRRSVQNILDFWQKAGLSPAQVVRSMASQAGVNQQKKILSGWVHRFNTDKDLIILLRLLALSWERYGSLGAHFLTYHEPGSIYLGLSGLIGDWKSWIREKKFSSNTAVHYLLTSPEDGSCCKRWCMLLRWMGRNDPETNRLDIGLWTQTSSLRKTFPKEKFLRASELVIPLDTHTSRITRYLGLTSRKTVNWKMAIEVTTELKKCDPEDPVRYDFAISRLGILDFCKSKYVSGVCEKCQLFGVCKLATRKRHGVSCGQ